MRNLTGFSTNCCQPEQVSVFLSEVNDLVQIGLRALVDPENRSFRRMRGRDTAKTLRQDGHSTQYVLLFFVVLVC